MSIGRAFYALPVSLALLIAGSFTDIVAPEPATRTLTQTASMPYVVKVSDSLSVTPDSGVVVDGVVAIPADSTQGVRIGSGSDAFSVELPGDGSDIGTIASNGVVTYDSPDGANDTVVPTSDGVQFLKILPNRASSETFTYPVDLPEGGRIVLTQSNANPMQEGAPAAIVLNGAGQVVALIEAPWAKDANGADVETYFTTDGQSLTQHVLHRQQSMAYPVVADPHFRLYKLGVVVTFTYNDMVAIAGGGIIAATALIGVTIPTLVGPVVVTNALMPIVGAASWSVATRSCAWLWLPYPWTLKVPDWGYYDC